MAFRIKITGTGTIQDKFPNCLEMQYVQHGTFIYLYAVTETCNCIHSEEVSHSPNLLK